MAPDGSTGSTDTSNDPLAGLLSFIPKGALDAVTQAFTGGKDWGQGTPGAPGGIGGPNLPPAAKDLPANADLHDPNVQSTVLLSPKMDGATIGPTAQDSVNTSVKDSAVAGVDKHISDVTGQLAQVSSMITQAYNTGKAVSADAAAKAQQQAAATQGSEQAQAQVDENKALALAKQKVDLSKTIANLGLSGDAFQKETAAIAKNTQDVVNTSTAYKQANSVSFFDNPLSYLYNQIVKVPILQSRLQDQAETGKVLQDQVSGQAAALDAGVKATSVIDSADSTQQAALIGKVGMLKAAADASGILSEGDRIQLSALGLATTQAGQVLDTVKSSIQLPYMEAAKDSLIQEMKAKTGYLTDQDQKLRQSQIDQQDQLNSVNLALSSSGLKPVAALAGLPSDQKLALLHIGQTFNQSGSFGVDPVDVLDAVKMARLPAGSFPAGQVNTINEITNARAQAEGEAKNAGLKGAAFNDAVHNRVNQIFEEQRDYPGGKDGNAHTMFSPEPLNSIVDRKWALNNPVLQAMKSATIDGSGKKIATSIPTRFQDVMDTAAQLVADKKLSMDQAAGAVTDVARNSIADKDKAYGFRRFALFTADRPDYKAVISEPGGWFATKNTYDMFSKSQVMKYLQLKQAALASDTSSFINK